MSDSSSEEEIPDHLRQSVDKHFMNDSLFSNNDNKHKHNDNKESTFPPSLRPTNDDDQDFTKNGLTKSNQKFIADRLSKILDEKLNKTIIHNKNPKCSEKCDALGGVLLFSDSNELLRDKEEFHTSIKKRKRKKNEIPDEELEERCKEVSVSSNWITSGAATKGWTKSTKGEVIHVKKLKQSVTGAVECEIIK